jgi:hypothetical protein
MNMEGVMSNCNCASTRHHSPTDLLSNPHAIRKDLASPGAAAFAFDESTTHALVSVCVQTTASNGRICVPFPVMGSLCFSPSVRIPDGAVQVCMSTCGFSFGPMPFNGVTAVVSVNGNELWSGTIWGSC